MSPDPKITRTNINVNLARLGQTGGVVPSGWPIPFKRFFKFTVDMARLFSKNLSSDHTEKMVKEVEHELKKNQR